MAGWKELLQRKDVQVAAGVAVVVASALLKRRGHEGDTSGGPAKSPTPERAEVWAPENAPSYYTNPSPSPSRYTYDPNKAALLQTMQQSHIQMQRWMNDMAAKGPWRPIPPA